MSELEVEEAAVLTAGASMWQTAAIARVGIPSVRMADGPMGVASPRVDERDVSVLTPAPVSLGATWDVDLVRRVGRLVGCDAATRGVDLILAPNLNLARSPLAGRAFEYFSEDPLLAGMLGASWITGVQETGVGAVAKHLVCNDSETDRDSMNAIVDERALREVYLLPFELAARAGCAGMLTAYNKLNGSWCSESGQVITRIAKREWEFPGVFMSDWFGTHSTIPCLAGGLDLEMPGPGRFLGPKVAQIVATGEVEAERVRDAAARVAAMARRFSKPKEALAGPSDTAEILIDAAAASFTLVKNDRRILPLVPGRYKRIAVLGPNATAPCFQGGTFAKIALTPDALTPLDAIHERYGSHCEILHEPGLDPQPRLPKMTVQPMRDLGDGFAQGMTVEYFDDQDAGEPMRAETRNTNSLTWFHGVHEVGALQQPALTRASGRFTANEAGVHRFYVGGTGAVRLLVDGRAVISNDEPVPASDVMGRLKSGEAAFADVDLLAGQTAEVIAELRYSPARAQGLWYGIRGPGSRDEMLGRAETAARSADAVILMVGETSDASVESKDRSDTKLDADQIALIERVTGANPNTVILANVGHAIDTGWERLAAGLMFVWYPGQEFGPAIASVLAGDREPGGRMPMTIAQEEAHYPAFDLRPAANGDLVYVDGVRIGYRGLVARGLAARHPFGSGLGYADLEICEPRIARENGQLVVRAVVRNRSDRAGSEVVQLYRDIPERSLVAFAKVRVEPQSEAIVKMTIPERQLMTWDQGWQPIEGLRCVRLGRSSEDCAFELVLPRGHGDRPARAASNPSR